MTPQEQPDIVSQAEATQTPMTLRQSRTAEAARHVSLTDPPGDCSPALTSDDQKDNENYPEGGTRGRLCVIGSFMALLGSIGLLNSMGTFSAYLEVNQLKNHSPGEIGWIFGVYSFLFLFCGLQVGPISDARGPRALLLTGSTLIVISLVTIGFCSQYWHFMLSFGITGGIGVALIFTPAVSAIGHYFHLKRGTATGLALGGGSVGGVIFPLVLQHLFEKIGFAWATRVLALICLVCLTCGCLLVSSRLPKKSASRENLLPDLTIFLDAKLALTALCSFFLDWALFIPITYISSYALSHGINQRLSYQLLAILNAASFFGRWLPGYAADKFGRFNTLIVTVTLCLVCNLGLWLPAGNSAIMIITYSACFGFASGSNISLLPVCVGQLCDTKHYGRYYSTCFLFSSFSALTGIPIAGEILSRCQGNYWGLITFTSCCYAAALITAASVKILHSGWNRPFVIF